MRCNRCGYLSFDYLTECKKCRVDLTQARESLGLLNLAVSAPLFLNSMLNRPQTAPVPEKEDFAEGESFIMDLPEIEFEEDQTFDRAMQDSGEAGSARPKTAGKTLTGVEEYPSGVFSSDLDNELTIELTDEDLSNVFAEGELTGGPDPGVDRSSHRPVQAEKAGIVRPEVVGKAAQNTVAVPEARIGHNTDDDLAIDFGDEDLEELLMELEDTGPQKSATPKADRSAVPEPGSTGKKS